MANGLNMHELAREGAVIKLQALETQLAAIKKAFPDLARNSAKVAGITPKRRTWHMSAKARIAASERMAKYWRERKANSGRKAA